jgi:hypothetical protein
MVYLFDITPTVASKFSKIVISVRHAFSSVFFIFNHGLMVDLEVLPTYIQPAMILSYGGSAMKFQMVEHVR